VRGRFFNVIVGICSTITVPLWLSSGGDMLVRYRIA